MSESIFLHTAYACSLIIITQSLTIDSRMIRENVWRNVDTGTNGEEKFLLITCAEGDEIHDGNRYANDLYILPVLFIIMLIEYNTKCFHVETLI